ncbi:MAG: hypothetical protein ACJ8FY_07225 [Gemmataceae bacterium]
MTDSTPPSTRARSESLPRERTSASPPRAPGATREEVNPTVAYKPLSLLAVAGMAVAVPYALFLLVGGLTAVYTGSPFLLSGATVIIPLTAAVLSLVALIRVNRSEGVLGGGRLATWGLRISLLFGLGYWAYFLATFLAVRQQADEVGRAWLQKIMEGRINSAFLMAIDPKYKPPREDPSNTNDEALRKQLETRFDGGGQTDPRGGMFSQFPQQNIVRLLQLLGNDAKIEFIGSTDWEYKDGYAVGLRYRVSGQDGAANIKVVVQGVDNEDDPGSGRRWFVVLQQSGLEGQPEMAPAGEHKNMVCQSARLFLQEWLKHLGEGYFGQAYLQTVDANDFDRVKRNLLATYVPLFASVSLNPSSVSAPAAIASGCSNYLAHKNWEKQNLPGLESFIEGGLVRPSPKGFSAQDDAFRQMVLKDMKDKFKRPAEELISTMKIQPNVFPIVTENDGKFLIELDVSFRIIEKQIMVDGAFVLECDKDIGENGKLYVYRVKSLDLQKAKKVDFSTSGTLRRIPLNNPGAPAPEAPGAPPPP